MLIRGRHADQAGEIAGGCPGRGEALRSEYVGENQDHAWVLASASGRWELPQRTLCYESCCFACMCTNVSQILPPVLNRPSGGIAGWNGNSTFNSLGSYA